MTSFLSALTSPAVIWEKGMLPTEFIFSHETFSSQYNSECVQTQAYREHDFIESNIPIYPNR